MISYKNRENLLQNVVDSLYYFNRIKFIYKDMANEIHSLKIGDVEYPIYSEGIKIDDQVSGSAFLVVDGPDNRKVGTSTAIIGDDTNLTISSNEMYIGTNSTTKLHVGNTADWVEIGTTADLVDVGNSATELHVGNYGTTIGVGESAEEVNIGRMSYGVNIGNQCEGNVVIADGSVWTSEDEDGNEIIEQTTSTFIGENNYEVNIGPNASSVILGGGAKTINIGSTATDYLSILSYGRINIDSNHGDVDITSENHDINILTLGSDGVDNGLINIEAERDANMIAHRNINIDATYGDGETTGFVNINAEGNVGISSGVGKVNILADTGISLEASNNNIDITSTLGQININSYDADESAVSILADTANDESTASLDINYDGIKLSYDCPHNTTETYINMSWAELALYYNNDTYGGNELIVLGTDGTTIMSSNLNVEAPNIYIDGMTTVYPEECTTTEMNTGFSVLRGDNRAVGVVFCAPSQAKGGMVILPKNAYNSTSNVVNLGNTSKRFSGLFVVSGRATNGFTTDSDERLKDFGDDIAVDLDALAALRKSYYRWNETSGFENEKDRMLGMSAQEVQKIYPELVDADENGMLSMAYDRLSVVALAAIDKLHETNKELKAENDELKDRIANLENLVNAILSRIN